MKKFEGAQLPVAGDDIMSQVGATVLHKTIVKLLVDRGAVVDESYQLNIGGDTDFQNMIDEERLASKRESKTSAVQALVPYKVPLHIGPSDFVPFLENTKISKIKLADETGSIRLSLWNDRINKVHVGDEVELKTCNVARFRGEPQLRIRRSGSISVINQSTS